jgi:hypothetical protein
MTYSSRSHSSKKYPRCYETHPPLPIGDSVIYGGSCGSPIIHDADVYVGFDYSMEKSPMSYPWVPGESFYFPIADMHAPSDLNQFKSLITWLHGMLLDKKKVHIGCVGGHGRTGTVLAALVRVMIEENDAIGYVRHHYCQKAVESEAQVSFLVRHFGILPAAATKMGVGFSHGGRSFPAVTPFGRKERAEPLTAAAAVPSGKSLSIWGPDVVFDNSTKSGIIQP